MIVTTVQSVKSGDTSVDVDVDVERLIWWSVPGTTLLKLQLHLARHTAFCSRYATIGTLEAQLHETTIPIAFKKPLGKVSAAVAARQLEKGHRQASEGVKRKAGPSMVDEGLSIKKMKVLAIRGGNGSEMRGDEHGEMK